MLTTELDRFRQRVTDFRAQLDQLQRQAGTEPLVPAPWLATILEGLSIAVGELGIAAEELRAQYEKLAVAQRQLEEERQRYRDLFDFAPIGYLQTDTLGFVEEANRAALALFGADQLVGRPLAIFVASPERANFYSRLQMVLQGAPFQEWELRLQTRSGECKEVLTRLVPVHDTSRNVVALRWLLSDLSSTKQVTAALEEFRKLNEAKDELLALVSHELRSRVSAIHGWALYLRNQADRLDEESRSILDAIQRDSTDLQQLIHDMFALARVDMGQQLPTEPVLLPPLINEAVHRLRQLAPDRPVHVAIAPGFTPIVAAEERYLQQVLQNILNNAEKYSPKGSPIEVQVAPNAEKNAVVISILDRGPGVPPEDLERIFTPFYRSEHARRHSGSGLGLTVCRRLIEAMSGHIWASLREGGGLQVCFTLPLYEGE